MDAFTRQYIETALWSSTDDNCEPLDKAFGIENFDGDALSKMTADCKRFQKVHYDLIDCDLTRAGHDFWLTRNGHGTGFWDGDWIEHGDALTSASKEFGECLLYIGDDNKVHVY